MLGAMPTARSTAEDLASAALEWLASSAQQHGDGIAWTGNAGAEEVDPTLYSGGAGIVLAFLEAHRHFGDERWAELAALGARGLAADVDGWEHRSLYWGTTGIAFALHSVARQLDDRDAGRKAEQAMAQVGATFDGERWGPQFDLLGGNAGVALGALALGDVDLAQLAVAPYLRTWEATAHGVTWENRRGIVPRRHHMAHGTLGIAYALAATGHATGRVDLLDLARSGVEDVVSRNDADAGGFLVPHSDPQQDPDRIDRYSYGWCHGPTGDAQAFRLLHRLTGEPRWLDLQHRCWSTVLGSGLPRQVRPGFWDNSGHCCGTAGVLALASDREVEHGDGAGFAAVLVDDLRDRATVDAAGARWSNYEHRVDPPVLAPRQGWGMGSAGIVRELLRHARIADGRDPSYAVEWPDQPA
jgi:lantibiotic modifying enzyme